MHNSKGTVFNIQRFSTSDGPGIRTVVFLKGCPLSCIWCHNPESHKTGVEIFYNNDRCVGCRACESICPAGNHKFDDSTHFYNRTDCTSCGKCTDICLSGALECCGELKTVQEILSTVLKDRPFYEESDGGVTLSGGEPLSQFDFSLSLLKLAKAEGLHTAIETCGFTEKDLTEISRYVDLWLFDIKLLNESEHIKYTGVSNKTILKNLRLLDSMGASIILRCPIIPDINLNNEHFTELKRLALSLKNVKELHLEPYHPLGQSKSQLLGTVQGYKNDSFLDSSELVPFADMLKKDIGIPVIIL